MDNILLEFNITELADDNKWQIIVMFSYVFGDMFEIELGFHNRLAIIKRLR